MGGGGKTETRSKDFTFDPTLQRLQTMRGDLAMSLMQGNIPEMMSGYLNKVLIPGTTNSMTAAGLGRSGAVGEAVSSAIFSQGTNMLTSLLTGIPGSPMQPGRQSQSKEPGFFDYFSSIMGAI